VLELNQLLVPELKPPKVKQPKVKPPEDSVVDNNFKKENRRAPSYRRQRAPGPESETIKAQNTPNRIYSKNKKYQEAERNQDQEIEKWNQKPIIEQGSAYTGGRPFKGRGNNEYSRERSSRPQNRGRDWEWLSRGKR